METNEKTPEQLAAEQREREKAEVMRQMQMEQPAQMGRTTGMRLSDQAAAEVQAAPPGRAVTGFEATGNVAIPSSPVGSVPAEDKVAVTTPNNNIPRPAGAPPVAIVPAVPDPSAVPSNVLQQEEVFQKQRDEFMERNAQHFPHAEGGAVYNPGDVQFQQPGAPAQQWDNRPLNEAVPAVSEKTRAEMEAGRKRVETRSEAVKNAEGVREEQAETARVEREQLMGASGETGDQLEAKRLEALRRAQTWGDGQTSRPLG